MNSPETNARAPQPAPESEAGRATRAEAVEHAGAWRGILVLTVLLACFFASPLSSFSSTYYSSADLTQGYSWTAIEAHEPGNRFLSDPVVQMQPWLMFNKESLHRAELPLWNPYNGGGVPHLANYQSAVLSPFSFPFYVLSFRAALLVSAFLKLFGLGLFTFLFLRELRLGWLAASIGATVFTFSGQNVLLLSYPHTAANIALPAGLYFLEKAIGRFVLASSPHAGANARRSIFWPLAGLCASMTAGLLAGQPEPVYFAGVALAIYAVARLAIAWTELGRSPAALRDVARMGAKIGAAAALALGISALQLIPFLEYLQHSHVLELRSSIQTPLRLKIWPLLVFPDLVGNPSGTFRFDDSIPPPDFETANMVYGGGIALFTALLALAFLRRRRTIVYAGIAAVVWFAYAYDLLGFGRLIGQIPVFSIAPINRSHAIWHMCIACLSALAVQQICAASTRRRWPGAIATLSLGAVLFALVHWGAASYADWLFNSVKFMKVKREAFDAWREPHMAYIEWTSAAGVIALSALWIARSQAVRTILGLAIVAVMFLQTGWLLRAYNPTTEDRFFFPRTPSVEALARHVGNDYVAIMSDDTIPPASNAVYGLSTITSYDAMWIREYDRLYRQCFGESNRWRTPYFGSVRALELFGVDWVATKGPWIRIDTTFARIPWNPGAFYKVGEIVPGAEVVQTFTASAHELEALLLFVSTYNRTNTCTLRAVLEDNESRAVVASQVFDCSTLIENENEQAPLVFSFPRVEGTRGRSFTLRLQSPDATEGASAVTVWARRDFKFWENELVFGVSKEGKKSTIAVEPVDPSLPRGLLTRGAEELKGGLVFDLSSSFADFERVDELNGCTLYRLKNATSRFHVVSRARYVRSGEDAFAAVQSPRFDPSEEVIVLGENTGANDDATSTATRRPSVAPVEQTSTRVTLRASLERPGHLVTARAWYPGWTATVNGVSRPVLRVNYAFVGVELNAGENKIELSYEPGSVRLGMWISMVCLLASAAWCGVRYVDRRSSP